MTQMTLSNLARLTGVSVSTVSKVMSGSSEISEDTRNKIIAAAKENGCFDRYYKGGYDKTVIAIIIPELSEYYSRFASQIESAAKKRGCMAFIAQSEFSDEKFSRLLEYFSVKNRVDGIISIENRSKAIKKGIAVPIVALQGGDAADKISIDFESAIADAVSYLKENGHEKIAFIGEKLTNTKLEGFKEALNKNFLLVNNDYIRVSDKRFETAGYETMQQLLNLKMPPTAVIAAYDNIAIGAMRCIKRNNLSVPDDVSLIGMDAITAASYDEIALTTIRTNYDALCEIAVDLIMKKVKNKYFCARQSIMLQCDLIIRGSVKNLNAK